MEIITTSVEQTLALGELIGWLAAPNTCIALHGNLGAGKTHLTRGIAVGAGVDDPSLVSSPTYVLLNVYRGKKPVFHMDAYRVESEEDFAMVGFEELLKGGGLAVVEWAEKVGHLLPAERVEVSLEHGAVEESRVLTLSAMGDRARDFLKALAVAWDQFKRAG
jgi:tRNA threonylcarbamoyladenosine biosynthesis protein TsaE